MSSLGQDTLEKRGGMSFKRLWNEFSIVFVFIILYAACTILTGGKFGTWQNMSVILRSASTIGIIGLGMTYVIISGGIDLSSGPVLACVGTLFIYTQKIEGMPLIVPMIVCVGAAVGIGYLNGLVITKAKIPPFIVTLATGIIARSITMHICQGATVTGNNTDTFLKSIGNGSSLSFGEFTGIPNPFIIMIVLAVILTLLLTKTKFGTYVFSIGCNENAARYSGIKVDKTKTLTYMLVGACVGMAAVVEMSRMVAVSSTSSGDGYEFDAITAVLVGGTSLNGGRGTIYGTVIGAIILFFVNNMMVQLDISIYLSGALKGAVILIAVLLQARSNSANK